MLKPKHCYANEDVYNYNLFMHKATVMSFALDPRIKSQVKFILRNEETKDLNCEKRNRFVFFTSDNKSKMFYKDDAISILKFVDIILDPRIEDYKDPCSQIKYLTTGGKESGNEWITVLMGRMDTIILDTNNITSNPNSEQLKKKKRAFNEGLLRLKAIMEEFLRLNEDGTDEPKIPFHSADHLYTVIPLVNKWGGWTVPASLRLMTIPRNGQMEKNSICLSYRGKDVLLYSRDSHVEGSSDLSEVVEGFITGLKILVNAYHNHYGDMNEFIKAVPVSLSEDRRDLMEYVGGRGVGGDGHDGPYRNMLINVNSDAAPGSSKTMFHHDPDFMEDLYNGLRFLVNL